MKKYVCGFDKNGVFVVGCVYKNEQSLSRPAMLNCAVVLSELVNEETFELYKAGYYRNAEGIPTKPEVVEPALSELRTAALSRIDSSAQSSILSGFGYEIDGEILHFSYQYEDQQNFSDTFNAIAMKKLMGVDSLPDTIGWNGWRNHTNTNKGELVRLNLDVDSFLELYTKGALAHKSYHMTIHGERKKAIESAQSVEEINALLEEWSV
jgi:hypothetical protein